MKTQLNWLIRIEGINMVEVMADTTKIPVIRGASMALSQIVAGTATIDSGLSAITLGGATALFELSHATQAEATAVVANIRTYLQGDGAEKEYPNKALKTLSKKFSFTLAWLAENEDQSQFNHDCNRLLARSRHQQLNTLSVTPLDRECSFSVGGESASSHFVCPWHRFRPSHQKSNTSIEAVMINQFTYERHQYGLSEKKDFINAELEAIDFSSLARKDYNYSVDLTDLSQFPAIKDQSGALGEEPVEEPGRYQASADKLNGKVAVLYFDANHLARYVSTLSKADLHVFDQSYRRARQLFLLQLISHFNANASLGNEHRGIKVEILLWGGDEILMVVPAWAGFLCVQTFFSVMKQILPVNNGQRITHAGGVVFSQHKTPIQKLTQQAQELAEYCKRYSRQHDLFLPMLLESEDYPTQSIKDYWETHYPHIGKYMLPLQPQSDACAVFAKLQNTLQDEELSGAIRRGVASLLEQFNPDKVGCTYQDFTNQLGQASEQIEAIIQQIFVAIKPTDIEQDGAPLAATPGDLNGADERHHLLAIIPWLLLVEYRDYLFPLEQDPLDLPTLLNAYDINNSPKEGQS